MSRKDRAGWAFQVFVISRFSGERTEILTVRKSRTDPWVLPTKSAEDDSNLLDDLGVACGENLVDETDGVFIENQYCRKQTSAIFLVCHAKLRNIHIRPNHVGYEWQWMKLQDAFRLLARLDVASLKLIAF